MTVDTPLDGALWAIGRGFAVHPLDHPDLTTCAGIRTSEHDPATCTERGKHPATAWSKSATVNPEQVVAWFAGATRNYGIATGPSGVFVIDDDAADTLVKYAASIGETIPKTLLVATARGFHYYFQQVNPPIGCSSGSLPAGIDVKGAGGYVVGPGSRHASGATYQIVIDQDPAPAPAWLLDALRAKATPAPATATKVDAHPFDALAEHTGPIPLGQRHTKLLSYAGHLRERGFTLDEAHKLMAFRWQDCAQTPGDKLTFDQAKAIVDDSYTRYGGPGDPFVRDVQREVMRLRVIERARAIVRDDNAPPCPPMDAALLDDIADEPVRFRIDGLIPWDGNPLIVAKRKTGKTTFLHNLTSSLRSGEAFLGALDVEPIEGRVGLLNYELPAGMMKRWGQEAGLTSGDLFVVNLRNRRNPLGNDDDLATLTRLLIDHDVQVLMVDPLSRAFVGDNINDTTQMTRFLASLDQLKGDIGAHHVVLAAHAGWHGDRARNSSVVEDWADVIVTLTSGDTGDRFMSAVGRDVELDEDRLHYDIATRRLSLTGAGSRAETAAQARVAELADAVVDIVNGEPGITVGDIEDRLRDRGHGLQKGAASRAAATAEGAKRIIRRKEGRTMRHYPIDMPQHAPTYPGGVHDIPRPALSRAGDVGGVSATTCPNVDDAVAVVQELLGAEVVA